MPQLPDLDLAWVPDGKILTYLLNPDHPKGAPKCEFLRRFGFRRETSIVLRDALLAHAQANDVTSERATFEGIRYEIDGPLLCPDGRAPIVRVVWFRSGGTGAPRLITLVPRRITL